MRVLGISYEGLVAGRGGAKEGPYGVFDAIRFLEPYSIFFERSITLEPQGVVEIDGIGEVAALEIEEVVSEDVPAYVGGDHFITLGLVRGFLRRWGKIRVVVLDAHLDARDEFRGDRYNHATVIRRIYEEVGDVTVMGVRNVSGEELEWARGRIRVIPYKLKPLYTDTPVYLSIDVDVFDPSEAPGVGTPEPGGISFRLFLKWLKESSFPLVGFDIVEVSPPLDHNGITQTLAATILREVGAKFFG